MSVPKIVLIGDSAIGKTKLVYKARNYPREHEFTKYVPTIGQDAHRVDIDGRPFTVWDCAGQEKFSGLREGYYIGADAAIVMAYDVESASKWVRRFRSIDGNRNKPVEIVDSSADLDVFRGILDRIPTSPNSIPVQLNRNA
jgi:small GTP-binding protein